MKLHETAATYRIYPKIAFNREKCEIIIKEVVDENLEQFTYSSKTASSLCNKVSEEIKNRVKELGFDRLKNNSCNRVGAYKVD